MEITNRNLYNDNVTDVNSVENLKDDTLNLLSKKGTTLQFEYSDDFWKLENGVLYQYPDYVSMYNHENSKVVFNSNNMEDENNPAYGKMIVESIKNDPSFEMLSDISLQERNNYIKNADKSVNGAIRLPFSNREIDGVGNIQRKSKQVDDITSKSLESIDKQETKAVLDLVKLAIKTLALSFIMFKPKYASYQNDKIIDKIIKGLDDNTLDINKILADRELNQRIPELGNILKRYSEQYIPLNMESQKEVITEIVKDKEIISVADKLSEDKLFKEQLADKFSIGVIRELDKILPDRYDEKMIELFSKSDQADPLEFSKELLLKNLEEIYQDDKKITAEEYSLSVAFLAQMVNPKGGDKNLLAESFAQVKMDDTKESRILDVIEKIAHKCIKNELEMNKNKNQQI